MKRYDLVKRILVVFIVVFTLSSYLGGCTKGKEQSNGNNSAANTASPSINPSITTDPNTTPNPTNNEPSENTEADRVKVKALYLTGWTVGDTKRINHFVDLAKSTEVNSYVVDIKDDDGYVGYESQIPDVREFKAWKPKYNVDEVIKAFHDNNIHVIGRVVCFKDPIFSAKRSDLAVKNSQGGLWRDDHGLTWLNPYNQESWEYLVNIAKEAIQKGFDEIQFDYVRFPNDGDKKAMNFGNTSLKKYEAIDEFLAYAKKEMPDAILSADVFGIICESPADTEDIGQNLEFVGKDVDYISPMAYPSHYAVGQIVNNVKFLKPDLEPYGVVYNTLFKAKERISKVESYKAKIRPYIQDFTASWLGKGYYQTYGTEQVKQQIKAVYDAGLEEWILWDADNSYSESALAKE